MLSPSIEAPFADWIAAGATIQKHHDAAQLLSQRLMFLRNMPSTDGSVDLRCLHLALTLAAEDASQARSVFDTREEHLLRSLEDHPTLTASDKMALASLLDAAFLSHLDPVRC